MSICKINFVDDKVVEVYTIVKDGVEWMVANPFAEALNYTRANKAIFEKVSVENQKSYEELQSHQIGAITSSLHPRTKFINRAGVFELINASEMPAAKRFKVWNSNQLLPTLCQDGEYSMVTDAPTDIVQGMNAVHAAANNGANAFEDISHMNAGQAVAKIKVADNKVVEVFTVICNGIKWMAANPFAEALGYTKPNKAIAEKLSIVNVKTFQELQSNRIGTIASSIHPKTKFINQAGVFELITASEMPAAKQFKAWNSNDLLPTLCQEGNYSMTKNAPSDIAKKMNAVHVVTNDGKEAQWIKDLDNLKTTVMEKDCKIDNLTVALQNSNEKLAVANTNLAEANKALVMFANEMIVARKETAELANRMADIAQDVIAKPSDPQLLHSLAVCAMGGDQYAFVRPQKRSLKRSLDRLAVEERDIVFKSDYVPNGVNVLNKVKEALPKDKFTARHNKITLLDDMTKEELVDVITSTMTSRQVALAKKRMTTE